MAHPEYGYWALLAFLTLPSAMFNRVAAIVIAQRLVTQLAWELGAPEPPTQAIVFIVAFLFAIRFCRNTPQIIAGAMFVPMTVASLFQYLDPFTGWWVLFWLACAQAFIAPFGNDWAAVRAGLSAVKDTSWMHGLFRREAYG